MLLLAPALADAAEKLRVVATFSILADMARTVGGERVDVHALIGADSSAHGWQPSPADARALAAARLVIINGLGFEAWIDRLAGPSGFSGELLVASRGVQPITSSGMETDPHAWLDLSNADHYIGNIANVLAALDPAGKNTYFGNASRYKKVALELDAEIRKTFSAIPRARRKAITTHDAFAYFARAYGIDFISPSNIAASEPSARDIGRIIRLIRSEKIPAVFLENISGQRALERIRGESGAKIGGTLYSDSLSGKDGPAATYLNMMRHNAATVARALAD
ncbi:MAG: zinc ABC transporter substrate-binding protein [Candidatus Accumulibacter sp.]|nr:zinc ABC transporter substrate-binding protein [Accumulibacter sp.]